MSAIANNYLYLPSPDIDASRLGAAKFALFFQKHCASHSGSVSYETALKLARKGQEFFAELKRYAEQSHPYYAHYRIEKPKITKQTLIEIFWATLYQAATRPDEDPTNPEAIGHAFITGMVVIPDDIFGEEYSEKVAEVMNHGKLSESYSREGHKSSHYHGFRETDREGRELHWGTDIAREGENSLPADATTLLHGRVTTRDGKKAYILKAESFGTNKPWDTIRHGWSFIKSCVLHRPIDFMAKHARSLVASLVNEIAKKVFKSSSDVMAETVHTLPNKSEKIKNIGNNNIYHEFKQILSKQYSMNDETYKLHIKEGKKSYSYMYKVLGEIQENLSSAKKRLLDEAATRKRDIKIIGMSGDLAQVERTRQSLEKLGDMGKRSGHEYFVSSDIASMAIAYD